MGVTFVAAKGRGQEPATASDDLENRPTICEADLSHAHILLLHLFGWFEQGQAVAGGIGELGDTADGGTLATAFGLKISGRARP